MVLFSGNISEIEKVPLLPWIKETGQTDVWKANYLASQIKFWDKVHEDWLGTGRPSNKEKTQLAVLIQEILNHAKENRVETWLGKKLEKSYLDLAEQYLRTRSNVPPSANNYPTKYEYHRYYAEYICHIRDMETLFMQLIRHLEDENFLEAFDELPQQWQLNLQIEILPLLSESRIGLIYLKKWTFSLADHSYLPFCHIKRLQFLSHNVERSEGQPVPKPVFQALQIFNALIPGIIINGSLRQDELWILREIRPVLEGLFPHPDFNKFNMLTSPLDMVKVIKMAIGLSKTAYMKWLGPIVAGNPINQLRNPFLEIEFSLKAYLFIRDPSISNGIDFSHSLFSMVGHYSETFNKNRYVKGSAFGLKHLNNAVKLYSAGGKFFQAWDAFEQENYDLGVGLILSGIGTFGKVIPGPWGGVLAIGGLVGDVLIFTDESELEMWLGANYFGKQWNNVWSEKDSLQNPEKNTGYLWRVKTETAIVQNIPRQIASWYSMQNSISELSAEISALDILSIQLIPPLNLPIQQITVRAIDDGGLPQQTFNIFLDDKQSEDKKFLPIKTWPSWLKTITLETEKGRGTYSSSGNQPPFHLGANVHTGETLRLWLCEIEFKDQLNQLVYPTPKWLEVDLLSNSRTDITNDLVYLWINQYGKPDTGPQRWRDSDQMPYVTRARTKLKV